MKCDSNCFDPNWAVYFLRAVLQLYSITKPSANDNANGFYQGRDHVWFKESELQRCYQQQVIECGKDVLFVFVFVLWQLATTHATGTQIVRAKKKIWARLVGKSRHNPDPVVLNRINQSQGGGVLPSKRLIMGVCRWMGSHFPTGLTIMGSHFQ